MAYQVKHGAKLVTTLQVDDEATALKMFKMLKLDCYEFNGRPAKLDLVKIDKGA